jgi:hypothetical protein
MSTVAPLGAARDAASVPMIVLAPRRFSISIVGRLADLLRQHAGQNVSGAARLIWHDNPYCSRRLRPCSVTGQCDEDHGSSELRTAREIHDVPRELGGSRTVGHPTLLARSDGRVVMSLAGPDRRFHRNAQIRKQSGVLRTCRPRRRSLEGQRKLIGVSRSPMRLTLLQPHPIGRWGARRDSG